jgi:hypothetical protein
VVKSIYPSIVIMVGTNVLTTADGLLNASIVRALVHPDLGPVRPGSLPVITQNATSTRHRVDPAVVVDRWQRGAGRPTCARIW